MPRECVGRERWTLSKLCLCTLESPVALHQLHWVPSLVWLKPLEIQKHRQLWCDLSWETTWYNIQEVV